MLRPIKAGMCKYESMLDGTLSIYDLLMMNDYLNVCQENEIRAHEAMSDG